ncbi:hypothetical protein ACLESO_05925 [Pyxidicoccus sp. 3LG]
MALRALFTLVLACLMTGCSTTRVVHLDTGGGNLIAYTPHAATAGVELSSDEFAGATRTLASTAPISDSPRDAARWSFGLPRAPYQARGRLGLVSVEDPQRGRLSLSEEPDKATELASAYGRW